MGRQFYAVVPLVDCLIDFFTTGEKKALEGAVKKRVDGYQRKKYVCKLIYIYLLGYDVDFGHMEALSLITSTKYWEKHVVCVCVLSVVYADC